MKEKKKMVKTYNKGECYALESDDLKEILDLTVKSLKKNNGHPAKYPNTKEGLQMFIDNTIEFFNYINERNANPELEKKLIPDVENWGVYMGVTRSTIFTYERRDDEWGQVIKYAKNAIASCKKQLALTYKTPPMIAVFDLVNNHGYVNSNEFHLIPEESKSAKNYNIIENDLEKELEDKGLVWDEQKGEYVAEGGTKGC